MTREMMSENSPSSALIDDLVESYIDRQRRGEQPSIDEYVDRYPGLADEIRSIFPTLKMMEEVGSMPEVIREPRVRPSTPIPTHIGEFEIVREIGRGGMGVVYEAVQKSLGRHVALKVLPARTGRSPILEERFKREAQSAANLHHTNIVPLFSVGEIDGVLYYAMQFIEGQSLDLVLAEVRKFRAKSHHSIDAGNATVRLSHASRAILTDSFELTAERGATGNSPSGSIADSASRSASRDTSSSATLAMYFRNVAQLGTQVASALNHAHSRGIIHRDIKPSNLILDPQGVLWVMDFGLAKAEGSDDLTRTGDVLGTVRYMAPEQFAGHADARADVYALGLTLYEMVTLRPAFDEPLRYRLIDKILKEEPTRPSLIEPKVPRDLETVLLRAIAKDPRDRYPTARALHDDLTAFLQDRPISARRLSYWERGIRWCRRNRMVASLTCLIVAFLVVALIASSWTGLVLRRERNAANAARDAARRELWSSKVNEARAITVSGEPDRRIQALSRVQQALELVAPEQMSQAELLEIRSVTASALLVPCVEEVRRWRPANAQPDGWQQTIDFDENLEKFAVRLRGGGVSLRGVENDKVVMVSPSLNQNPVVNMSSSGNFLAITDRVPAFERLEIWDISRKPASLIHRAVGRFGKFVLFSRDDARAAYFRREVGLEIVELATREVKSHATVSNDPWRPLAMDRSGTLLAYPDESVQPSVVRIHDLVQNAEVRAIRIGDHVDGLAWHPSGTTLAVGRADESISLFDVDSRAFITSFVGHTARGISLAFNHRGDRLFSNDWENRIRVWDVGSRQEILSFPSQGRVFRIHPGDELLGTEGEVADGSLRVLRLEPGRALRTLHQTGGRRLPWNLALVGGILPLAWGTTMDPIADRRGLAAVSLITGEVIAVANHPSDRVAAVLENGSVVSYGRAGVFHWPRLPSDESEEVAFGSPIRLDSKATERPPGVSRDARIVAIPRGPGGATLIREGKATVTLREGLEDIGSVAVDPDGTSIALANFNKPVRKGNVRIVNAISCSRVAELDAPLGSYVSFSPDGNWLIAQMLTSTSHCRIWRVGEWDQPIDVDGLAVAIDATGTLAASSDSRGGVRLFRLNDGQDIIRFSLPGEESLFVRGFSDDGHVLLVGSSKYESARLLDLGMIRRELASLGLDWNDPSIPPAIPSNVRVRWPASVPP